MPPTTVAGKAASPPAERANCDCVHRGHRVSHARRRARCDRAWVVCATVVSRGVQAAARHRFTAHRTDARTGCRRGRPHMERRSASAFDRGTIARTAPRRFPWTVPQVHRRSAQNGTGATHDPGKSRMSCRVTAVEWPPCSTRPTCPTLDAVPFGPMATPRSTWNRDPRPPAIVRKASSAGRDCGHRGEAQAVERTHRREEGPRAYAPARCRPDQPR